MNSTGCFQPVLVWKNSSWACRKDTNRTCSSFLERSSTRLVWTTINGFLPLIASVYAFGMGFWRTYRSGASVFNIFAASCNNWWRSASYWKRKGEADDYKLCVFKKKKKNLTREQMQLYGLQILDTPLHTLRK